MRRQILILILLLAIFLSPVLPQRSGNFSITNYNLADGLVTNKIHHAAQDSLQRLWFATGMGVSIYDGFKWENIHLLDNQNNAGFKKVIIDEKGHAWLLPLVASHRIKINRGVNWDEIRITVGSPVELELLADGDVFYSKGKPVVAIAAKTQLYLLLDDKWTSISTGGATILGIEAVGESFYLAGSDGLATLTLDANRKPVITKAIAGITTPILAVSHIVTPASVSKTLVLGTDWIGEIRNGTLLKFMTGAKVDIIPTQSFYYISEDHRGNIYFGNKYLKYSFNTETGISTPLPKLKGFTSDGATSAFVDTEGNIWFCDLRGIDKITFHPFTNYYQSDGLLEDEVTAVIEFEPGKFIFGHNSGYTVFSREGIKTFSFRDQRSSGNEASRVLDLAMDEKGTIWAACGNYGLVRIDPSGGFTRVAEAATPVSSVLWDKRYGLLVGTAGNLYILKGTRLELVNPVSKPANLRKLFRLNDRIYAASATGIFLFENQQFRNLIPGEDQMTANVFALLALSKDSMLVGTEAGLYIFTKGRLLKFNRDDFSISKSVYFIIRSKYGDFWFGTADGLIRWDGASNIHEYIVQDGLAGYEMNRSAALIDTRNTLWIGTNTGLSTYMLGEKPHKVEPPRIWLASVETSGGEKFSLNTENIISQTDNSLSFTIRGISFISEGLIKYRVKLEGFDKDFYEITQSQLQNVRYLNLPSGAYRLVVMAKNRFSEWSEPVYSKVILVEKAIYLQTWFILLILTIIGVTILLGNKFFLSTREQTRLEEMVDQRTNALRLSQAQLKATLDGLEEEVRLRTAELQTSNRTKDKIFSIISHDLRSPFMSILGYSELLHEEIENMDPPTIRKYTDRIMDASQNTLAMVDGLLEWSKLQMGGVVPTHEEVNLALIAHEIEKLFHPQIIKKGLTLVIEIDEDINLVTDPAILRSVIRNLVSNAIKFTPQGGLIKVSAVAGNSFVEIEVVDTGIGIPEEMLPTLFTMERVQSRKGTASEKGTGLGLSLVYDLLKKVGGEISVESTVGTGTIFRVILPIDTADIFPEEG